MPKKYLPAQKHRDAIGKYNSRSKAPLQDADLHLLMQANASSSLDFTRNGMGIICLLLLASTVVSAAKPGQKIFTNKESIDLKSIAPKFNNSTGLAPNPQNPQRAFHLFHQVTSMGEVRALTVKEDSSIQYQNLRLESLQAPISPKPMATLVQSYEKDRQQPLQRVEKPVEEHENPLIRKGLLKKELSNLKELNLDLMGCELLNKVILNHGYFSEEEIIKYITRLVNLGADVKAPYETINKPLYSAISMGLPKVVKCLWDYGAEDTTKPREGELSWSEFQLGKPIEFRTSGSVQVEQILRTPPQFKLKKLPLVRYLLKLIKSSTLSEKEKADGLDVLLKFQYAKKSEELQPFEDKINAFGLLLDQEITWGTIAFYVGNIKLGFELPFASGSLSSLPLFLSLFNNDIASVRTLLKSGFTVNEEYRAAYIYDSLSKSFVQFNLIQDASRRDFPIHWAVRNNKEHLVALLLEHGANTNVLDYLGRTLMEVAAQGGNKNIIVQITKAKVKTIKTQVDQTKEEALSIGKELKQSKNRLQELEKELVKQEVHKEEIQKTLTALQEIYSLPSRLLDYCLNDSYLLGFLAKFYGKVHRDPQHNSHFAPADALMLLALTGIFVTYRYGSFKGARDSFLKSLCRNKYHFHTLIKQASKDFITDIEAQLENIKINRNRPVSYNIIMNCGRKIDYIEFMKMFFDCEKKAELALNYPFVVRALFRKQLEALDSQYRRELARKKPQLKTKKTHSNDGVPDIFTQSHAPAPAHVPPILAEEKTIPTPLSPYAVKINHNEEGIKKILNIFETWNSELLLSFFSQEIKDALLENIQISKKLIQETESAQKKELQSDAEENSLMTSQIILRVAEQQVLTFSDRVKKAIKNSLAAKVSALRERAIHTYERGSACGEMVKNGEVKETQKTKLTDFKRKLLDYSQSLNKLADRLEGITGRSELSRLLRASNQLKNEAAIEALMDSFKKTLEPVNQELENVDATLKQSYRLLQEAEPSATVSVTPPSVVSPAAGASARTNITPPRTPTLTPSTPVAIKIGFVPPADKLREAFEEPAKAASAKKTAPKTPTREKESEAKDAPVSEETFLSLQEIEKRMHEHWRFINYYAIGKRDHLQLNYMLLYHISRLVVHFKYYEDLKTNKKEVTNFRNTYFHGGSRLIDSGMVLATAEKLMASLPWFQEKLEAVKQEPQIMAETLLLNAAQEREEYRHQLRVEWQCPDNLKPIQIEKLPIYTLLKPFFGDHSGERLDAQSFCKDVEKLFGIIQELGANALKLCTSWHEMSMGPLNDAATLTRHLKQHADHFTPLDDALKMIFTLIGEGWKHKADVIFWLRDSKKASVVGKLMDYCLEKRNQVAHAKAIHNHSADILEAIKFFSAVGIQPLFESQAPSVARLLASSSSASFSSSSSSSLATGSSNSSPATPGDRRAWVPGMRL